MALIECPHCGHQISEFAASCPQCGHAASRQSANQDSGPADSDLRAEYERMKTRSEAKSSPPSGGRSPGRWVLGIFAVLVGAGLARGCRELITQATLSPVDRVAEEVFDALPAADRQVLLDYSEARGLSESQMTQATSRLAASGLVRLSDDLLMERARIMKRVLDNLNTVQCALVTEGGLQATPDFMGVIEELDPGLWQRMMTIGVRAAIAEIRDYPPPVTPSVSESDMAFQALAESMSGAEADRFVEAIEAVDRGEASPVETCWLGRTLFGSVDRLSAGNAATIARLSAMPE